MTANPEAPSITPVAGQGAASPGEAAESDGISASNGKATALNRALFWSVVILACATPLTYWPKWSWSCFPFYDVGIGVVFSLSAASWFAPRPALPKLGGLDLALALFLAWVGVNAVTKGSWSAASPLVHLSLVLFLVAHAGFSAEQSKRLLLALMVTGGIVASLGMFEYSFEHKRWVTATLLNPNTFSGYLCLLLPMSFCLWKVESAALRVLGFLITTVMAFGMTISLTRGGYLAVLVGMCGFALMKDMRLLLVIALYCLVFGFTVSGVGGRLAALATPPKEVPGPAVQNTVTSRLHVWQFGWEQFKAAPFTGIGMGNFRNKLETYVKANPEAKERLPEVVEPHNSYIKLLCELGLPGLALFLSFVGSWICSYSKPMFSANLRQADPWAVGVFWGLISFLVHNLTNTLFILIPCALGFWLALAALTGIAQEARSRRDSGASTLGFTHSV